METKPESDRWGDFWGGLAAMLVALPSSIAFGVAIYSPLGADRAAEGALAGILGATALGIVAPLFGGTLRLISSPCAPAAAVMGGLAAALAGGGAFKPEQVVLLLALTGLFSGFFQLLYGLIGAGRLIKYMPYPVVTGYLSGVGLLMVLGQLPKLLGLPKGIGLAAGLAQPALWQWPGIAVGLATIAAVLLAPKLTKAVPAPILGLAAGLACYFGLASFRPELLRLAGNPLLVGPIPQGGGSGPAAWLAHFSAFRGLSWEALRSAAVPALTLSLLLSIDTLKTAVVIDTLTRSRHDSNKELVGQGLGNIASALAGGVPGAGGMGVTLVNIGSGGRTRLSSVLEGLFVLAAYFLLSRWIGWVPIGALAGLLILVGARMMDRRSLELLKRRSTALDFLVAAAVVVTAVLDDLITAAGVGLALAMLLFVRDQIGSSVIRRKRYGDRTRSKQHRLPEEAALLQAKGADIVVCELQGSLFFGTTDQLFSDLEEDLKTRRFLILDLRRVQSVDFTGTHVLELIAAQLEEKGGRLILCSLPRALPSGQDLSSYFREVGLVQAAGHVHVLETLDDALQWVEDRILKEAGAARAVQAPALDLRDIDLLRKAEPEVLEAIRGVAEERFYEPGKKIFQKGDAGDELFLIRRGAVRIELPLEDGKAHHLASFARADFFGDMAFLDGGLRSADAVASEPTELYVISRARFDEAAKNHPWLAHKIFSRLSRALALRLRQADSELGALQEA